MIRLFKISRVLIQVIFLAVVICSCKKSSTDPVNGTEIKGDLQLNVHVLHHANEVSFIDVYLKRNATSWPGTDTTKYDLHFKANGYGMAVCTGLFPGNYFVYAQGYDSYYGVNVLGYSPVTLNSSTLHDFQADLTLYVSE